jgi:alkanesulfonate monooxygenase SsuD/methylene tetrahydromethanopterin reductase-like flavin-dependent oxidoreductase (luciferase family)
MRFGVFDHLDRDPTLPLAEQYEARLRVAEALDSAGFYGYHLAEHHLSRVGIAPSPSVYLAALAQRTRTLRFGPMIFAAPLYHPVRLVEEIAMLDQISRGRLEMGFGRGASAAEQRYFGQDPAAAQQVYSDTVATVLRAFTEKSMVVPVEDGMRRMDLVVDSLQQPHPPLWYGAHSTESAARAARQGMSIISLDPPGETRQFIDAYLGAWRETHGGAPPPSLGFSTFVVVAATTEVALARARRAYAQWRENFYHASILHGHTPTHARPASFDAMAEQGRAAAGTGPQVAAVLRQRMAETGANYCVVQIAFGDLTLDETLESVRLFARDVMPAVGDPTAAARS